MSASGALLTALRPGVVAIDTEKGLLKPGSSKQGKNVRASVGSSLDHAYQLSLTLT